MGWAIVIGIETRCGLGSPGIESWWVAIFSATIQTGPRAQPASCKMGAQSLCRGKAATVWC